MEVHINDKVCGLGTGHNKKGAEQEAAKIACETLLNL